MSQTKNETPLRKYLCYVVATGVAAVAALWVISALPLPIAVKVVACGLLVWAPVGVVFVFASRYQAGEVATIENPSR